MRVLPLLVFFVSLSICTNAHEAGEESEYRCIHNEMLAWKDYVPPQEVAQKYFEINMKRGAPSTAPIRVEINTDFLQPNADPDFTCYQAGNTITTRDGSYTCSADDVLTPAKANYLIDQLLAPCEQFIESALRVVPVSGNLTLSPANCYSSSQTPLVIPSRYQNPGAPVDLVIFVTARPIGTQGVLAFAGDCLTDQSRRPIAGFLNMNPPAINLSPTLFQSQYGLVLHEITHILGFSWGKMNTTLNGGVWFSSFRDEDNNARPVSDIIDVITIPGGQSNRPAHILKTDRVLSVARAHYNCPGLQGVELENQGEAGTALSHWEKRILWSEFMVGTSSRYPVVSAFTLAYLEDTGWYEANLSVADPFFFGFRQGCNFVQQNCLSWSTHLYLCSSETSTSCSFDRRAKARCGVGTLAIPQDLPLEYQFFPNPRRGGTDQLADFCPFFSDLTNGWCMEEGSSAAIIDTGEIRGIPSSRCFDNSLARNIPSGNPSQGCYEHFCAGPQNLKLKIGEYWYSCPWGERIRAVDFGGDLTCPLDNALCHQADITPWPEFESVTPDEGPPGTPIIIRGSGFTEGMTIRVHGKEAVGCEFINETEYHCEVPPRQEFRSLRNLLVDRVHIVMLERASSMRKSTVGYDAFDLKIQLNEDWLLEMAQWLGENPLITAAGVAFIFLGLICCGYFIYRERQRALKNAE